jgi:hypothetical protein
LDKYFRRAFRKLTGRSLLRFSGVPDRDQVLNFLVEAVDPIYSIALREHLDLSEQRLSQEGGDEFISESRIAQKLCSEEFEELKKEIEKKFDDFRSKWAQRLTQDQLVPLLNQGGWILPSEKGFEFKIKGDAQDVKNFYYETLHFMTGDAEKLVVTVNSRVLHIQEKLTKIWHGDTVHNSVSKILPTLERGARERENAAIRKIRESMAPIALNRFSSGFVSKGRTRISPQIYPTAESLVRGISAKWNTAGVWENGFMAFMEDYADYARGICIQIQEWYQNKWMLYLRGFSRGQLDFFEAIKEAK